MEKTVAVGGKNITYELCYKKVKNINLRIKQNGKIYVSANKCIPQKIIDDFIISKYGFILNVLEKYENIAKQMPKQFFTEDEIKGVISEICERVYPYFEARGIKYPEIKFRCMVSMWGNCQPAKGILKFNTNLMYAPYECIEYVVLHEFTHFLQANHSKKFYDELAKICPQWEVLRKKLKEINIR